MSENRKEHSVSYRQAARMHREHLDYESKDPERIARCHIPADVCRRYVMNDKKDLIYYHPNGALMTPEEHTARNHPTEPPGSDAA